MFHMEHCVFCAVLSPGTNKTNCGRPCDVHQVKLRDRDRHGARAHGRRRLPQHALQRRAAKRRRSRRRSCSPAASAISASSCSPTPATKSATLIGLYRDLLAGRISRQASLAATQSIEPRRRHPRHARRTPQPAGDSLVNCSLAAQRGASSKLSREPLAEGGRRHFPAAQRSTRRRGNRRSSQAAG